MYSNLWSLCICKWLGNISWTYSPISVVTIGITYISVSGIVVAWAGNGVTVISMVTTGIL